MSAIITTIAKQLQITEKQVNSTIQLLNEGATIPFIARYRKEVTGGLDEVQINDIKLKQLELDTLNSRRDYILSVIESQDKLTPELKKSIEAAQTLIELEDLYLPYKPKRRTRATIAKDKGLEPLADFILKQYASDLSQKVQNFLTDEVPDEAAALQGARDIIAEQINEHQFARSAVRHAFERTGMVKVKLVAGKSEEEAAKFKDYFDMSESLKKCPSHRYLAMLRGEKEGFLRVTIDADADMALNGLDKIFLKGDNDLTDQVAMAVEEAYKRLLKPAISNEFRAEYKAKADHEAIQVFAQNLHQLLMASPVGNKRTLALDPGYRTGCKIVCLNEQGDLLHHDVIYPHPPQKQQYESTITIQNLCAKHQIEVIAIGNGTASRESEAFIKNMGLKNVEVFVVNESGASIYSASPAAREEFPNEDVTVRGAVSIGRRLMDPLAELVKIDPKSIGVGQYQHDVDQNQLKQALDTTVESCVNAVGVDVNMASKHLLSYVSGLGPAIAQNIVDYRKENGAFKSRKELKKVSRLGDKAFEQCAGFLRIAQAKNALDNSAVHPERYKVVEKMAKTIDLSVAELIGNQQALQNLNLKQFVGEDIGLPTLNDIKSELLKPGRDPRGQAEAFHFDEQVKQPSDLHEGMILPGLVTNITNFGAFVDVGVKQDGLVHVSEIANKFIQNPADHLKLQQRVQVKVLEVDLKRSRISLSIKQALSR